MREWFEVAFRVVIPYGIYTFNRWGYLIFQEWHDVLCSIIGKCLCWCRPHHMNNSCHVQHNNCDKSGWTGQTSCLFEVSHDLPNLVVPFDSQSEKIQQYLHQVLIVLTTDCTDRKSCVIRVMFFFCTPLVLFPFLLRSGRLLNVRIVLRWIVFDTGMVTWLIVCATYCASAWRSSPSWWTRLRDLMTSCSIITCVSSATHSWQDRTGFQTIQQSQQRRGHPSCT